MKVHTIASIVPIHNANTGALMYYKALVTCGSLYTSLGISFDSRIEALLRACTNLSALIERTEGTHTMLAYQNNLHTM